MADYSLDELLAVVVSRRLRDGELGLLTTGSPVHVAACGLAQRRGRWVSWVSAPLGALDPRGEQILSITDERALASATAALDLSALLDAIAWRRAFFDFALLDALQVDRFGNLNTVCVGPHEAPSRRGPGVLMASAAAGLSRRFIVIMPVHEHAAFVEQLDFRSAVGHASGGHTRQTELGLPAGGPEVVVTALGCFDFDPETKVMRVESLHPGVTIDDVRERTGFELAVAGRAGVTPAPTDEELRVLRSSVDRDGILRREERSRISRR